MIASNDEYRRAQAEIQQLEEWLARLNRESPLPAKGLTRAGIRKMIARLHDELAEYEGTAEVETAEAT